MKIIYFFLFLSLARSTLFNGHPFPTRGPFFEGWYIKTIDFENNFSIANIIAKHFSDSNKNSGYLGFLFSENLANPKEQMKTYDIFSEGLTFEDCHGALILSDPDLLSSPCLTVTPISNDNSVRGFMKADSLSIEIHWSIKNQKVDIDYRLKLTNHTLWSESGLGPQGITSLIPKLGLYWFVFSVKSYSEYSLTINGKKFQGKGYSHVEKNWGDSFPESWMWAEGIKLLPGKISVEFAIAGGPKQIGQTPISPVLYLVGYKSEKLDWSFHPQDILVIFDVTHDSCQGEMNLIVKSPSKKLVIKIKADVGSFKNCLYGPSKEGMKPMCLESFSAVANIEAYSSSQIGGLLNDYILLEKVEIPMSALEFGGGYLQPCFSCQNTILMEN